jgi:hypothetical protein
VTARASGRAGLPALAAVAVLMPLGALLAVWGPVLAHYHVTVPAVAPAAVERLRAAPDGAVLEGLAGARYGLITPEGAEALRVAEGILAGRYETRRGEEVPVTLAPGDDTFRTGSPMAQLQVSSLAPVQVLVEAWRLSGDERYLAAALESALGWARYERDAWLPEGFLWNDHAVASRVVVLANLWREYRGRDDFDPAVAAELLAFVSRSTALLARDSHFTARTNHGVMQNLALLHAAVAFPDLPGSGEQVRTALDRLELQLGYYVSPGGVVLEHSAGYQDFAIRLLRQAQAYTAALGLPAPDWLVARYRAALCFRSHFTRPDGSVPNYGDTFSPAPEESVDADAAAHCAGASPALLDQDFGYASLRDFDGGRDQLFVAWANFPGRAHKHDDDLAAWLWIDGRDWWTGSGYWPYGEPSRRVAVSWRGANAPHAEGEASSAGSASRLLGYRDRGPVPFLDLERRAADGARYRRQVAGLGAAGALVIDSAEGSAAATRFETAWTLPPDVVLGATPPAGEPFVLHDTRAGRELRAWFLGGDGHLLRRLRDSREPFGGLVVVDGTVRATETLVSSSAFGSWLASAWRAGATDAAASVQVRWTGPDSWVAELGGADGVVTLARQGAALELTRPGEAAAALPIVAGAVARPALAEAEARFRAATERYPVFRDLVRYRARASAAIAALFAVQLAGLALLRRFGVPDRALAVLVTVGWAAVAAWLYHRYLA